MFISLSLSQFTYTKTAEQQEEQIHRTLANDLVMNIIGLHFFEGHVSFANIVTLFEIELKKTLATVDRKQKNTKIAFEVQELDQETNDVIQKYSKEFSISERLVRSVILKESAGHKNIVSYAGACGLMQVMPNTFKEMTGEKTVDKIFNPDYNIYSGIKYLKYLLKLYKGNYQFAIMAYNAGPFDKYGNVKRKVRQFPKVSRRYYRSIWSSYTYMPAFSVSKPAKKSKKNNTVKTPIMKNMFSMNNRS